MYINNVDVEDSIFLGFEHSMKLRDIGECEKRSFEIEYDGYPSMSINVYDYDKKFNIRPVRVVPYDAKKISIFFTYKTKQNPITYIYKF